MEFSCNCNAASKVEKLPIWLVEHGYAKKVHESNNKEGKDGFRIVCYEINVKQDIDISNLQFEPYVTVSLRFKFDERRRDDGTYRNEAGIKVSDEGLMLLIKSKTALKILQKIGLVISEDGKVDINSVADKFDKILTIMDDKG